MGPFETLLDIERDCKAYAVNIPRQIVTERDWYGIGFKSNNCNFACPLQEVTEVLLWPNITEVPGAHTWFKGVANLRGRILPVTDLKGFITKKPHKENVQSRILVVSFEGALFGFSVEQVLGIERFFREEIKPSGDFEQIKDYLPYVQGAFERERQPWFVMSFHSLIQNPEFYHVISLRTEVA